MSDNRQDPPSEHSADETADASASAGESADASANAVSLIEQALVRIRRDQSRRRLHRRGGGPGFAGGQGFPGGRDFRGGFPGGAGGPGGPGEHRGGPWGDPRHDHDRDRQQDHGRGEAADGRPRERAHDHEHDHTRGNGRDDDGGTGRRTPHDRSLGQAARFRMLDAIESAGQSAGQSAGKGAGAGDAAGGGMGISALAAAIGVDQPRASRLVAEATERGHVRRAVDPQDGRRSVVQLTDAGRAILHEAHRGRRDAVTTALSGFTAAEKEQLAVLLSRFVDAWPREEEGAEE